MIKQLLAVLISIWLVSSCSTKNTLQPIDKFIATAREIPSQLVPIDTILADPYQLQYLDGYLLWIDKTKERLLTIYDLQKERIICQIINEGKGPGEVLPPIQLLTDPEAHTVGLLQRRTGHYTTYRLSDLLTDTMLRPIHSFQFDYGQDHCVALDSNRYLSAFYFLDTIASAAMCDSTGHFLEWINTFPEEIIALPEATDRFIKGQSFMSYLPDHQVLSVAYTSHVNRIQFYDFSGTEPRLICEYGVPGLEEKYTPRALQTASTGQFFYLLWMHDSDRERYILKFNAQGEVVDCIHLVPKAYRFCVTPDNATLYTLSQNDHLEPVIFKYQL